ncbi:hypothetical protein [Mangrovimonas yunxiaonensis]|uniref:hypothetical protein n=1 Tax=Mangrovimonas yunxiaonensis TaxID=1197477 RepID=UPI000B2901CB|nr:hypothetical protein [Mangrovimonas yunxiaonensis]GGH47847.1 hypothetical protein GCM10011364_22990 [Mangrovimonas yunxiaonensis]
MKHIITIAFMITSSVTNVEDTQKQVAESSCSNLTEKIDNHHTITVKKLAL